MTTAQIAAFAPHLVGRMLPALLTNLTPRRPRFADDPWASQAPTSCFYWMHATGCEGGLYRAMRNEEFWQRVEENDPSQPRLPDSSEFPMWLAPAHREPMTAGAAGLAVVQTYSQLDLFTEGAA